MSGEQDGRLDPLAIAREAGRRAGQAAPPLSSAQQARLRVLFRHAPGGNTLREPSPRS